MLVNRAPPATPKSAVGPLSPALNSSQGACRNLLPVLYGRVAQRRHTTTSVLVSGPFAPRNLLQILQRGMHVSVAGTGGSTFHCISLGKSTAMLLAFVPLAHYLAVPKTSKDGKSKLLGNSEGCGLGYAPESVPCTSELYLPIVVECPTTTLALEPRPRPGVGSPHLSGPTRQGLVSRNNLRIGLTFGRMPAFSQPGKQGSAKVLGVHAARRVHGRVAPDRPALGMLNSTPPNPLGDLERQTVQLPLVGRQTLGKSTIGVSVRRRCPRGVSGKENPKTTVLRISKTLCE